jgi:chromosome segregation ATPase
MDPIYADEIPWRLTPAAKPSFDVSPSTADERGMLYADILALEQHLASVQADCAAYRELAQTAIEQVADLSRQLRQKDRRLADQQDQIRRLLGSVDDQQRSRGHGPVT